MKYECSSETKILELIPDGILAVDRDLAVVCINPAACRLLGVPEAAEAVGRPVGRIMDDAAFLRLRDGDEAQFCDQCAAPEGNLRLERAFVRDAESSLLLCRMHAVGQEREAQRPYEGSRTGGRNLSEAAADRAGNRGTAG